MDVDDERRATQRSLRHPCPMQQPPPTSERPSSLTVADVVDRLGSELIAAIDQGPCLNRVITGVSVYDPLIRLATGEDQALLAVGVDVAATEAVRVVERAAQRAYSAVIFHADSMPPAELGEAARRGGIALLLSPTDVSWGHLAAMLRVGVGSDRRFEVAGVVLGDLFAFANRLATDVGGAVTVEDPQSRVLAYSKVEADVDEPRKETILGRQVPLKYVRVLQEQGVFRRLMSTDGVVYMDAILGMGLQRRIAVNVRAAGETLGSIWIAEAGQALAPDAPHILAEAAHTAALHIVRDRLDFYHQATRRGALVRELLEGGGSPDVLAVRLGLEHHARYSVLGFEAAGTSALPDQLLQAVEAYCSTFRLASLTVDVGPRIYCVVPLRARASADLRRLAEDAGRRAGAAVRASVLAAVGPVVSSADRLTESRAGVDRVLRVLLRGGGERVVADLEEVQAEAGLLEILDVLRERPHLLDGRLGALTLEANEKSTVLLRTLRAYLDHFGDVAVAADALQIHPNTFRYRLRRVVELTGLDLSDPAERLMTALQLRLL